MIPIRFRPIEQWPGTLHADDDRQWGFTASHRSTMQLLDKELRALDAENIVIQLALREAQIRIDGWPKADSRPSHPGVIVAFDSKHGALKYATDLYKRGHYRGRDDGALEGWQCNLRAIALGLEALRKVDRYGITQRGEQYTGWRALGSGIPMGPATMSLRDAAELISREHDGAGHVEFIDDIIGNSTFRDTLYRSAAKRTHPDVGGDTELFQRLQDAKRILDEADA